MPVHPRPQVNIVNTVGGNKKRRNLGLISNPRAANPKKVKETTSGVLEQFKAAQSPQASLRNPGVKWCLTNREQLQLQTHNNVLATQLTQKATMTWMS
jgi:hypothetical protein